MIWSVLKRQIEQVLKCRSKKVKNVEVTNDSKYVVAEYDDMTIKVWNLQREKVVAVLSIPDNVPFYGMVVSKIENKIFLCSGFGISVYDIDLNVMTHGMIFIREIESYYNADPCFEDFLMPQIVNND